MEVSLTFLHEEAEHWDKNQIQTQGSYSVQTAPEV